MNAPTARAFERFNQRLNLRPGEAPAARPAPTAAPEPDWDGLKAAVEAEVERNAVAVETPDPEAGLDRLDELHRRQVAKAGARIAATRKRLRAAQANYEAERLALERRWAAAIAEGEAAIEADERLAAKCRAFLGE